MVTPNHLWIMGSHAVKIELFEYKHAVYQHVHTINLGSRKLAGLFLGKTDKGILIRKEVIIRANRKDNPVKAGITLINKNGEIIHDSILKVPFQEQLTVHHSGNTITTGKSYGNRSLLAFDGNCIYTLWTDSLSIDRYSLNGDHRKAFSYPLSPVKITDKEKEEVLNKYPAIFRDALQRGLPDVKPVVNKFIIDDQHRIWMDLLTERLGKGWFCFTEEGKPLYKINIPRPGAELQEISGDLVLWNYRDEDGAPTIAVSKIKNEKM